MLRWLLSKWNYRLPGKWAWLPGGTLAANMLGTTIDFGLEVSQEGILVWLGIGLVGTLQAGRQPAVGRCPAAVGVRQGCCPRLPNPTRAPAPAPQCILQRSVSVGYWGSLWISAVTAGFCGSLTTVSTFVSEVRVPALCLDRSGERQRLGLETHCWGWLLEALLDVTAATACPLQLLLLLLQDFVVPHAARRPVLTTNTHTTLKPLKTQAGGQAGGCDTRQPASLYLHSAVARGWCAAGPCNLRLVGVDMMCLYNLTCAPPPTHHHHPSRIYLPTCLTCPRPAVLPGLDFVTLGHDWL